MSRIGSHVGAGRKCGCFYLFAAFLGSALAISELDLLTSASNWAPPSTVGRCPVHAVIVPVDSSSSSVKFEPDAHKRNGNYRFSALETSVPAAGLAEFTGLRLDFTGTGLGNWKIGLMIKGSSRLRFTYQIEKPNGGPHSIVIPWDSFWEEEIRRTGVRTYSGATVDPASVTHVKLWLYNPLTASLTIHKLAAMVPPTAILTIHETAPPDVSTRAVTAPPDVTTGAPAAQIVSTNIISSSTSAPTSSPLAAVANVSSSRAAVAADPSSTSAAALPAYDRWFGPMSEASHATMHARLQLPFVPIFLGVLFSISTPK